MFHFSIQILSQDKWQVWALNCNLHMQLDQLWLKEKLFSANSESFTKNLFSNAVHHMKNQLKHMKVYEHMPYNMTQRNKFWANICPFQGNVSCNTNSYFTWKQSKEKNALKPLCTVRTLWRVCEKSIFTRSLTAASPMLSYQGCTS